MATALQQLVGRRIREEGTDRKGEEERRKGGEERRGEGRGGEVLLVALK